MTHSAGEYGRITQLANGLSDTVTTNHTESAWSMFRRAISGVNHKMSPKHLRQYVKAFAGLWNIRALDTEVQMLWVFTLVGTFIGCIIIILGILSKKLPRFRILSTTCRLR